MSTETASDSSASPTSASAVSPLAIHDLTVAYQRKPVVWDLDYEAAAGRLIAIVGPNAPARAP
jgi:manganese/zinc/iron transport system ATP- binding protein